MKKYMVLCVAGQSNAVGYDESEIPKNYMERFGSDRVFQLGFYDHDNLKVIPLGPCAQNFQDMRPFGHPNNPGIGTRGVHLPLAKALLQYIPEDYDILVIPCAYGGTGFTIGEWGTFCEKELRPEPGIWRWGVESCYYKALCARIRYALDQNPENKFLGMLWCQGEWDSKNADGQKIGFLKMTEAFFDEMQNAYPDRVYKGEWNKSIWYNMETVSFWHSFEECPLIWKGYEEWSPETYVRIPRSADSNEVNGTGITAKQRSAHFGNGSFENIVAPAVTEIISKRLVDIQ
jgi:putative transposase